MVCGHCGVLDNSTISGRMFKILKIDKTIVFAFAIEFSKDKKSGV